MKIKQRIKRTETAEVDIDFPLYVQHDVGDERTYIVTYRYELQSPHVPTFLVTTITETDTDFEVSQAQSLTVDTDISENKVSHDEWTEAVSRFEKWVAKCRERIEPMKR